MPVLALGHVQAGRGRGDRAGGRRGGGPGRGAGDRGGRGVGAGVVEVGPGRGGGAGGQAAVVGHVGDGDRLAGLGPGAVPAVGQGLVAGVGVGHRPAGDGRGAVVGDGQARGEAAAPVGWHAVGGGARRGGGHRRDGPRAAGHGQAERGQQSRRRHRDRPAQPPHCGSRSQSHVSTPPGVMAPLTTAVSAVGLTAVTIGGAGKVYRADRSCLRKAARASENYIAALAPTMNTTCLLSVLVDNGQLVGSHPCDTQELPRAPAQHPPPPWTNSGCRWKSAWASRRLPRSAGMSTSRPRRATRDPAAGHPTVRTCHLRRSSGSDLPGLRRCQRAPGDSAQGPARGRAGAGDPFVGTGPAGHHLVGPPEQLIHGSRQPEARDHRRPRRESASQRWSRHLRRPVTAG